jgi:hypothetical protein
MDAAISWLQTHPPAGLSLNGDHGSETASGRITAVSWTYQDEPAPAYTRAELTLAVAEDGADRSVLRADGQVLWVPPRTDAEHVPADIGQVRLQEYRGSQLVAHKVLTGSAATELAGLLNHLGRINMGPPRCPFDSEKTYHYTISFRGPKGSLVFTEWPECQGGPVVFVEADGHEQPALSDQTLTPIGLFDAVNSFLECQLGTGTTSRCSYLESNSPQR